MAVELALGTTHPSVNAIPWSELFKALAAPIGAFLAAWAGAYLGFRRTKRERALERRLAWHEQTIQALARYEERLERLRGYSRHALIVQRARESAPVQAAPEEIPKTFKVPEVLWAQVREAEEQARASLRLADAYTDLETQVACSTALRNTVNVVATQWIDISPDPEIPWESLSTKAIQTGTLRTKVQASFKRVLELDGFLGTVFPGFARWRLIRQIKRMKARLPRAAS